MKSHNEPLELQVVTDNIYENKEATEANYQPIENTAADIVRCITQIPYCAESTIFFYNFKGNLDINHAMYWVVPGIKTTSHYAVADWYCNYKGSLVFQLAIVLRPAEIRDLVA